MVNKKQITKKTKQQSKTADLLRLRVSGSDLARLLGITPAAITQGVDQGRFRRDAVGRYQLGTNVPAYCQSLRESRRAESADDQKAELDYWRAKKLKQETLEGRREIADQIIDRILARLRAACDRLHRACSRHPDTAEAVRALAEELEAQDAVQVDAQQEQQAEETEP